VQSATLTINHPPTVVITSPTNGAIFLALASFPVIADAQDIDGFITNVEFFEGTTTKVKIGESTNMPPYFIVRTNLPVGSYTFTATATDNLGAMGTSAPVSVTVISNLPLVVSGPIRLNYQTGFYEQTAHVTNPTPFILGAVGVLAYDLPNDWRVQNASFVTNGVSGVLYNQPVPPGASVDVTLKYYLGPAANTNDMPTLIAVERPPSGGVSVEGNPVPVTRGLFLADGTFLLNFDTVAGATYYVLYSTDLVNWKTSVQPVHGNGFSAQWLDYGPPATESLPRNQPKRFYRVLRVP